MSENMRHRVREAVSSGAHFEYHVAIEEHLAYARRPFQWFFSVMPVLRMK